MNEQKRVRRVFSPEQKASILHQIETDIGAGMTAAMAVEKQGIAYSIYGKWKKQLSVAVKSGLRNGRPPVDKQKRELEKRIAQLEAIVLSQAKAIADLKKETNWE
jgi:transposase-like protein